MRHVRYALIALSLSVGLFAGVVCAGAALPVAVHFPDANLETAVRLKLAIPVGDITDVDMLALTELTADSLGIVDLRGLEYAGNLRLLGLYNNAVSDLSPLAGLTCLNTLELGGNAISDLDPLAGLSDLRSLGIRENQISDLGPLSGLTSLTYLCANSNSVSDVAPLASLTQIYWLDLQMNRITDITPLAGMTRMRQFAVGSNMISDISVVSSMPDLTLLSFWDNHVSDLTPVQNLTQLTSLWADSNAISDLTPLMHLSINDLQIAYNLITDVSVISSLPELYSVSVYGNLIQDITPLLLNPGIGAGDLVNVGWNYLDLTPGSTDQTAIDALTARDANVLYDPQRPLPVSQVSLEPGSLAPSGWYMSAQLASVALQNGSTCYWQWDSTSAGGWTEFSSPFATLEGEHTLYTYAVNSDDIIETAHGTVIKIDTQAPASPIIDTATDPVNAANVTGVAASGHAEDDAWVTLAVSDGTSTLEFATTANGGIWSFASLDLSSLADGPITYTVITVDAAGNESAPAARAAVKDATAPAAPTISGNLIINQFRAAAMNLNGTAEPGSTVTVLISDQLGNNPPWAETGIAGADGSWNVSINCLSLLDGPITYLVTATDAAGNASPGATASTVKDTVPPDMPLITQAGDISLANVQHVPVAATGDPLSIIRVTITGANGTQSGSAAYVAADGTWYLEIDATLTDDGPITYEVFAQDENLNCSAPSYAGPFMKDTSAPSLSVNAPPVASITNLTAMPLSGTSEPGSAITIKATDEAAAQVTVTGLTRPDGSFALWMDLTALADGDITYAISAADSMGNETPASVTSSKDTQAPVAPHLSSAPDVTLANLTAVPVVGTAEPGSVIVATVVDHDGATATGSATADGTGNWIVEVDCSGLADGPVTYDVAARDAAGNISGPAFAAATKDTNSPPITLSPTLNFTENIALMMAPGDLGSDPDADTLLIEIITPPAHGTLEILLDGGVAYTPAPYFCDNDSFTYRISDGSAASGAGTVTLNGTAVNYPPVATQGLSASSANGAPVSIDLCGADPDGDALAYAICTQPQHGVVTLDGTTATYTPEDGYSGCDSFAFTASDSMLASGASSVSLTVTSANHPPTASTVSGPLNPLPLGSTATVSMRFGDLDAGDHHTAVFAWDDGQTSAGVIDEAAGSAAGSHVYTQPGVYTVRITLADDEGGSVTGSFNYVVIYDPSGGFVTGGGWISSPAGAYPADPTLVGKANFGFASMYKKGATAPSGDTEFQFHAASFNFKSTCYSWLVVSGTKAQFKGEGTVSGAGTYQFILTCTDGSPDRFRMKVWDKTTGAIVYDNQMGALETAAPTTAIAGGSIIVHK